MEKKLAINIFTKNFLGTEDKVIIDELDSISKIITLDKKENLFMEGNPATNIYYIISGSIKLYRISNEGKEIIIRGRLFCNAGEFYRGNMWIYKRTI